MQVLENNTLFTDISAEESALVSGGLFVGGFSLDKYIFGIGAAVVILGGVTPQAQQFAWENSLYGGDPNLAIFGTYG